MMSNKALIRRYKPYTIDTPFFSMAGTQMYARLVNLYDADTIHVIMPLGKQYHKFAVRLLGIDSPEIKNANKEAKAIAIRARDRLAELCGISVPDLEPDTKKKYLKNYLQDNVCLVWLECSEQDKFGRCLGNVKKQESDTEYFSDIMLREKLVYSYDGGTKLTVDAQVEQLQ